METKEYRFGRLNCLCCRNEASEDVAYVLYPMDFLGSWIEKASELYGTSIVVITGMDWDNDLTPWPAVGVPKGSLDFKGLASDFLHELTSDVIPSIERELGLTDGLKSRTLVGVSLSGLFTLWQWAQTDFFRNIATLSGSFWYDGFVQWIVGRQFAGKSGKCYMLLGEDEPHSANRTFSKVGACTEEIVAYLRRQGIDVDYDTVPGNHYQYPIERLDKAFTSIFSKPQD